MINKIIAISDINIQIYCEIPQDFKIGDILSTTIGDKMYKFEVMEINNNTITAIPLSSVIG